VVERPAAAQRQPLASDRLAWHDQQRLPIAALAAQRHGGIQQGGADAAPASVRGDHARQFWRVPEPVDPQEAEQPLALPPQQVLDTVAAAAAKVVPLQLQAAAIGLDHLPLKFRDRLQGS
jgi:hypothetical protein